MGNYGKLERSMASLLDSFPRVKYIAKNIYQRLNYIRHAEKGFKYAIHSKAKLLTPLEWVGIDGEPKNYFFGYYDKTPWLGDNTNYAVFHHIDNSSHVDIVLLYRKESTVSNVASSNIWNWQQGCMLQWLPKNKHKIIFNDFIKEKLVARIVHVVDQTEKIIEWPVQAVHPNGHKYISLNYKKLDVLRPDYGYSVNPQNFSDDQALEQDGLWEIDSESSESRLIISLSDLLNHNYREDMASSKHKVNHVMYSPSGRSFVFMHRWIGPKGNFSRLYVINSLGDISLLLDERMVSHYSWKDDDFLLVWGRTKEYGDKYYLINVNNGEKEIIGDNKLDLYGDGHPSFSPNKEWIVTDSYPNKARQRHLLLFNIKKRELIELGRFFAPWDFNGVSRCDLHPRWSPDGQMISFDSVHEGYRGTYFIDVSNIVNP